MVCPIIQLVFASLEFRIGEKTTSRQRPVTGGEIVVVTTHDSRCPVIVAEHGGDTGGGCWRDSDDGTDILFDGFDVIHREGFGIGVASSRAKVLSGPNH